MSDEKKLMGIPFKMLRMDDERTGLSPLEIIIWKATHPETKYADVPTTEEVAEGPEIDAAETEADETEEAETGEIVPPTEEQRLRALLTSLMKYVLGCFSAA